MADYQELLLIMIFVNMYHWYEDIRQSDHFELWFHTISNNQLHMQTIQNGLKNIAWK